MDSNESNIRLESICNYARSCGFDVAANYSTQYATFSTGSVQIRFNVDNVTISTQETKNLSINAALKLKMLLVEAIDLAIMLEDGINEYEDID